MPNQQCPQCGTLVRSDKLVCDKCGTLLFDPKSSTVHLRIDPNLLQLRRKKTGQTGTIALGKAVGLQIRGLVVRLEFEEGTEIVLGRIDLNNPDFSRFDLTAYGGHERGVSREHALLRYQDGALFVIDLASANGTLVNLQRLTPNEPRALKHNDELMVGTLAIKVLLDDN